ncbi:MAG TPA: hypothetical protein PL110_03355 [Candidatus Eremiobacteraeota bacterium]|nr:MAG: hypothetical protein BWY64_04049 [bacterium ADurb.Bin363]HPZ07125.1 hypothetical protein [Candidatus Eremiobacteraeota bacterium]
MIKTSIFSFLILFLLISPVLCQDFKFDPNMTGDELWRRVDCSLAGLRDYTSDFIVDASSRDIHLKVNGKLYCILPDKVKFVLEGLPGFLGEHKEIVTDRSVQDLINRKKFIHSIAMTDVINGEPYYIIKSSAINRNDYLQEARFWIHAVNYTSNRVIMYYSNGGYVRANQKFDRAHSYMLPVYQDISISFPEWRIQLLVTFSNFSINNGLNF